MILDTLILENVGIYAGRQEAELSPLPGRPVVLFGGMNGGGKTTILESLQLAFYGPKARLASRGATPYRDFLREAIHRGADISEGSAVTVRFRRIVEGETRQYEIKRSWRVGAKGVEEGLQVWCNGEPDDLLTQNWAEYIEGYLPSGIAHLFFFDGEQIKELAEGEHAAEILGTAIQTLLGLDIVDSLESDLKVLERRKRAETLSTEATQQLVRLQGELKLADQEQEAAMQQLGSLTNAAGVLAKDLRQAEDTFRKEGGEAFERRHALETSQANLQRDRQRIVGRLLELSAGSAPLLLVQNSLTGLEKFLAKESRVKKARLIYDALEERDRALLSTLNFDDLPRGPRRKVSEWMERDRKAQKALAAEEPILNADPQLAPEIAHMLRAILPALQGEVEAEVHQLNRVDEGLLGIQAQQERIPAADTIAKLQEKVATTRLAHQEKMTERAAAEMRVAASQRHKEQLERQISRLGVENVDERFAEEDRVRLLKHAEKVRGTLTEFRTAMIRKHSARLEALILECFQQLLRKTNLVSRLSIHPETFAITLTGGDGQVLPFARLSAGERQLLATSLLWGLARASGRPIPTVIDTPLGRLDSSHRHHLVERYFPVASHQVILLSTDEEIAEEYHEGIQPHLARQFLLNHDEAIGGTTIVADKYFAKHEAAS